MDKKVIGYFFAVLGLVILVFGAGGFNVPVISLISKSVLNILGMIFVGLGVVLVVMAGGGGSVNKYPGKRFSKNRGKIQDLPIYEGDNIIAYRRD
jgi:uncharacterized membrane protein